MKQNINNILDCSAKELQEGAFDRQHWSSRKGSLVTLNKPESAVYWLFGDVIGLSDTRVQHCALKTLKAIKTAAEAMSRESLSDKRLVHDWRDYDQTRAQTIYKSDPWCRLLNLFPDKRRLKYLDFFEEHFGARDRFLYVSAPAPQQPATPEQRECTVEKPADRLRAPATLERDDKDDAPIPVFVAPAAMPSPLVMPEEGKEPANRESPASVTDDVRSEDVVKYHAVPTAAPYSSSGAGPATPPVARNRPGREELLAYFVSQAPLLDPELEEPLQELFLEGIRSIEKNPNFLIPHRCLGTKTTLLKKHLTAIKSILTVHGFVPPTVELKVQPPLRLISFSFRKGPILDATKHIKDHNAKTWKLLLESLIQAIDLLAPQLIEDPVLLYSLLFDIGMDPYEDHSLQFLRDYFGCSSDSSVKSIKQQLIVAIVSRD